MGSKVGHAFGITDLQHTFRVYQRFKGSKVYNVGAYCIRPLVVSDLFEDPEYSLGKLALCHFEPTEGSPERSEGTCEKSFFFLTKYCERVSRSDRNRTASVSALRNQEALRRSDTKY